jgi:hypothetical protein
MDQESALRLADEAFDLSQKACLPEAEERYRLALADADPKHYKTPDIHGRFAGLLTRLNRPAEAGRQYERALQLELQNDPDESQPAVVMARYFLGEHYLRLGEAESARRVVAPSLSGSEKPLAWLGRRRLFSSRATSRMRALPRSAPLASREAPSNGREFASVWPRSGGLRDLRGGLLGGRSFS